ncbi:hypothetical protein JW960_20355 [candidate division KSB1 bacterium]|nr:hypothetical protein [candidate division KSB1 bacterium]
MIRITRLTLLLSFMATIVAGCFVTHGDNNMVHYTPTTDKQYINESGVVDIYFDGVDVKREYEQIGFVEAIGSEYSSNDEILNYLKYKAYKNGADAVIQVKNNYINREEGLLIDNEDDDVYTAKVFSGVAIKYLDGTDVNVGLRQDTSFVNYVELDMKKNADKTEKQIILSLIFIITLGIAFAIKVANMPDQGDL